MAALEVIEPGLMVQIQDLGRTGVGHLGIAQGGPMDLHAYCWANYLLGNDMNCPQLEITAGQASFLARQPLTLALTGADLGAEVNGKMISPWQTFHMDSGDLLSFQFPKQGLRGEAVQNLPAAPEGALPSAVSDVDNGKFSGASTLRAYLAIAGGFSASRVMGSVSTVTRDRIGGLHLSSKGGSIKCGDLIDSLSETPLNLGLHRSVPTAFIPEYSQKIHLGLIESYQSHFFSDDDKALFYSTDYKLSPDSDRMGYRLSGVPIQSGASGIISEGVAFGSVQIPENGLPIILMRDRQTIGGYPKLGVIAQLDLCRLAQAMPGSTICFYRADLKDQIEKVQPFHKFFNMM